MGQRGSGGNGSSKFLIHQTDMGGWVRIYPDPAALASSPAPADLLIWLSHSLTDWFRQRPQLRARMIVPMQREGDTVELHAWYDLGVFPDKSGQHATPVE